METTNLRCPSIPCTRQGHLQLDFRNFFLQRPEYVKTLPPHMDVNVINMNLDTQLWKHREHPRKSLQGELLVRIERTTWSLARKREGLSSKDPPHNFQRTRSADEQNKRKGPLIFSTGGNPQYIYHSQITTNCLVSKAVDLIDHQDRRS